MSNRARSSPLCIVIAGPNGAGKTTFAREFLSQEAGRLFLRELDRHARSRKSFAFESTLSGLTYRRRLKRWKASGYRIRIVYLRISSPQIAFRRIAARVKQGGHNVPRRDVLRRFIRSWTNFAKHYRLFADTWSVYDNSGAKPRLVEQGP